MCFAKLRLSLSDFVANMLVSEHTLCSCVNSIGIIAPLVECVCVAHISISNIKHLLVAYRLTKCVWGSQTANQYLTKMTIHAYNMLMCCHWNLSANIMHVKCIYVCLCSQQDNQIWISCNVLLRHYQIAIQYSELTWILSTHYNFFASILCADRMFCHSKSHSKRTLCMLLTCKPCVWTQVFASNRGDMLMLQ